MPVLRTFLTGLAAATALTLPATARAEPPLWVVRDADSEMLLFGSVHVLPPGLEWRPAALTAGLARADDVWFELPVGPATDQAVARLAATSGILPPDKQLFDLLTPADAQRLLLLARTYGIDPASLTRLEPWLAEVALAASRRPPSRSASSTRRRWTNRSPRSRPRWPSWRPIRRAT